MGAPEQDPRNAGIRTVEVQQFRTEVRSVAVSYVTGLDIAGYRWDRRFDVAAEAAEGETEGELKCCSR